MTFPKMTVIFKHTAAEHLNIEIHFSQIPPCRQILINKK